MTYTYDIPILIIIWLWIPQRKERAAVYCLRGGLMDNNALFMDRHALYSSVNEEPNSYQSGYV